MVKLIAFGFVLLGFQSAHAQSGFEPTSYGWTWENIISSDGDLPFWSHSNRYGIIDQQGPNSLFRIYSRKEEALEKGNTIRYGYGLEAVSRWSEASGVWFNQLFVEFGWKNWRLSGGRFNQIIGSMDNEHSIGSMMISPNGTPVPTIRLQTTEYTDVPFTKGLFSYSASFSHSWLEPDRTIERAQLHQKSFHLKLSISRFSAYYGVIHNVMWAGENDDQGRLPQSLNDYWRVVTARGAGQRFEIDGERSNALGNTVASYDGGVSFSFNNFDLNTYRSFYIEDSPGVRYRSSWDGIWGLEVVPKTKNRRIRSFVYEHVNTKRQDSFDFQPFGRATIYDHFLYQDGWTYEGRVLGNPLITFNDQGDVVNNILIAHHIATDIQLNDRTRALIKATYSRNYGVCLDQVPNTLPQSCQTRPEDEDQLIDLSELRNVQWSFFSRVDYSGWMRNALTLFVATSFDIGEFYQDRIGIHLGVSFKGPVN
ncbi:MAG: capsule assembly Wzi family protein [Bacteroidota bacterium]